MTEKEEKKEYDFFKREHSEEKPKKVSKKRVGKVATVISGVKVIVDYNGTGEMLVWKEEYKNLKKGDSIELP